MGDGAPSAPPKKKSLPFKPTALRKAVPPASTAVKDGEKSDDDGLDLFRQSKEMESIIAADREKKMRKKQKQMEEKQRRSSAGDKRPLEEDEEVSPPSPSIQIDDAAKERRVVEEDIEDRPLFSESVTVDGDSFSRDLVTPPPSKRSRLDSTRGSRSSKRHRSSVDVLEDPFNDSPSKQSLRSRSKLITPSKKPNNEAFTPSGAPLITLDSDTDEDINSIALETPSKRRDDSIEIVDSVSVGPASPELAPVPEPAEEEDEFEEYVRKAEEQRARDKAMLQTDANGAPKKEAAVDIVITSQIPNTKVAIIKYQFDRPLRLVRDSWIALQRRKDVQLPITNDDDIVLTWQGEKVYTLSTLLSLGIRPQGDGRIIADEYGKGGLSDGRTKVNMVAWTVEQFREEEELRQKREAGELSEDEVEEEEAERVRLRVKLKARDMEEVKLTVLLETTVETLVTGFRTQRGIGPDKDVAIWWDGVRLEEHETMESAEIDDLDTLEVHIK